MKKFLFLFFLLPLLASAQNVPNGNFESWYVPLPQWVEDPEFWQTDNEEMHISVTKDTLAQEGDFAMRVTAKPVVTGDYGEAYSEFAIDAIPAALNFYARCATEFGGVSVQISFFNQDTEVYSAFWYRTENIENYTLISIPLEQIEPVITKARITVAAQVGDFAPGLAWIAVDAMSFGEPSSVDRISYEAFEVYPNPVRAILTVKAPTPPGQVQIINAAGSVVMTQMLDQPETRIATGKLAQGTYILRSTNGKFLPRRFVVQ